ncbi:MAG: hypothetical protein ICW73_02680 [Buchnera aphidicola (Pentalonia nigronervosa)]|jgi:hypothetical protein|uniref:Uncharacterized protein n=1 Tax=Buchnera aphidicola (Pentalonia nigronervosa) TaxID=1309793 RepID=A0A7H1AZE7_9GAMM|nr:MAG: hypothetical protein ICW73_02680 [Buchnera aphidicola (Pentalonia nigronervosa)]
MKTNILEVVVKHLFDFELDKTHFKKYAVDIARYFIFNVTATYYIKYVILIVNH